MAHYVDDATLFYLDLHHLGRRHPAQAPRAPLPSSRPTPRLPISWCSPARRRWLFRLFQSVADSDLWTSLIWPPWLHSWPRVDPSGIHREGDARCLLRTHCGGPGYSRPPRSHRPRANPGGVDLARAMTGGRFRKAAAHSFVSQEFGFALTGSALNVSCPHMTGLQPHPIEVSYR
jgi:hypothetical protein